MCEILIGTCGYDYPDWKGVFYPASLRRDEFLLYYATIFNSLELDFSYYQMPTKKSLAGMLARSGGHLAFTIKATQTMTHVVNAFKWRDEVKAFREAIAPLLDAEVLTAVLLQFPQAFSYETQRRIYLNDLITEFGDTPLVVEMRNKYWQKESVYNGLAKHNVAWCVCDMPDLKALPKFAPIVTSSNLAFMRFHGRNAQQWYGTNATARYDYPYKDVELQAYKPKLQSMADKARKTQIFFNNHAKGNATVDAKKLMTIFAE